MTRTIHPKPRHAFTLIETVLAMTIGVIVIGTVTASIQTMTIHGAKLLEVDKTRSNASVSLFQVRSELRLATQTSAFSNNAITFTHPDVTGDSLPDIINYQWSGTPGDPLTRSVNAGTTQILIDSVSNLVFSYAATIAPDDTAASDVESDEVLFFAIDDASAINQHILNSTSATGQYFKPILPPDATSWKVTRIFVYVQPSFFNFPGTIQMILHTADPTGLPLNDKLNVANITYADTTANTAVWVEKAVPTPHSFQPEQGACITLEQKIPVGSATVQFQTSNPDPGNLHRLRNDGSGWYKRPGSSLWMYAYGTYMTPGTGTRTYSGTLTSVRIHATYDISGSTDRLENATDCINRPRFSNLTIPLDMEINGATPGV